MKTSISITWLDVVGVAASSGDLRKENADRREKEETLNESELDHSYKRADHTLYLSSLLFDS